MAPVKGQTHRAGSLKHHRAVSANSGGSHGVQMSHRVARVHPGDMTPVNSANDRGWLDDGDSKAAQIVVVSAHSRSLSDTVSA